MTFRIDTPYRAGHSILHNLDARVKVGLALTCILTISVTPTQAWAIWILLVAIVLMAVILAELKIKTLLERSILIVPFVLAALPLVFTVPGTAFVTLSWGWEATFEGAVLTLNVLMKMWLSFFVAITLTSTTKFNSILVVLQHWGLPKLLVSIIAMTWRYIFLLTEETQRLLRARASRSGYPQQGHSHRQGGTLAWRAQITGNMAGNLLLRGTERSERVYAAMLARGYDGEQRTSEIMSPLPSSARRLLWGGISMLVLIMILGTLLWG